MYLSFDGLSLCRGALSLLAPGGRLRSSLALQRSVVEAVQRHLNAEATKFIGQRQFLCGQRQAAVLLEIVQCAGGVEGARAIAA